MTNPITPAQEVASRVYLQFTNLSKAYQALKADGVPARPAVGNQPAVAAIAAVDVIAALGTANVAALDAALIPAA